MLEEKVFLLCGSWEQKDKKAYTYGYAICDEYGFDPIHKKFLTTEEDFSTVPPRCCAEGLEAIHSLVKGVKEVIVISTFSVLPNQTGNFREWEKNQWRKKSIVQEEVDGELQKVEKYEPLPGAEFLKRIYEKSKCFGVRLVAGIDPHYGVSGWKLKNYPNEHWYARANFLKFIRELEKFRRD